MAREQKWTPFNLGQPVYNALLAIAVPVGRRAARPRHRADPQGREGPEGDEAAAQADRPQGPQPDRSRTTSSTRRWRAGSGRPTLAANATANIMRNLWSYVIIFCGHFPDGALHFTEEEIEDETRAGVVPPADPRRRQLQGRPAAAHHVRQPRLPDRAPPLPRPAEQPVRRDLGARCGRCATKYDIPYTTGPLHRQYGQALRTIMKLSLPNALDHQRPARAADAVASTASGRSDDERPRADPSSAAGRAAGAGAAGVVTPHRGRPGPRPVAG